MKYLFNEIINSRESVRLFNIKDDLPFGEKVLRLLRTDVLLENQLEKGVYDELHKK